jgi:hypothetical protein
MEMVGATAIDLTAYVRSRNLNLFVRFVRFVVKHPISGPHAIGPITLVIWDWRQPCDRKGDRERTGARIRSPFFLLNKTLSERQITIHCMQFRLIYVLTRMWLAGFEAAVAQYSSTAA